MDAAVILERREEVIDGVPHIILEAVGVHAQCPKAEFNSEARVAMERNIWGYLFDWAYPGRYNEMIKFHAEYPLNSAFPDTDFMRKEVGKKGKKWFLDGRRASRPKDAEPISG